MLLEDSLRGVDVVRGLGPIVDVGSGGGAPGIPLAAALPDRKVTLLEAERRKADFLERWPSGCRTSRSSGAGRRSRRRTATAWRSPRRWRRRRSPPNGSCRWFVRAERRCSGSGRRPTSRLLHESPDRWAAASLRARDGLVVIPKLVPPRRLPRGPGMARKRPLAWVALASDGHLRTRESEGRRRQDDDRGQPRRVPRRGRRADLLIDLDPQANATSGAGRTGEWTSSYDLLDGAQALDLASSTRFANLELIPPAPTWPERRPSSRSAATASASWPSRSPGVADRYRFVFLDCPPSLGPLTVNALAAADRVLVPVQAEYYALEGVAQILGSIEAVRARLNPKLTIAGLLLTMVDGRTNLAADVGSELERHFGPLALQDAGPAVGSDRRGAEPRPAGDRVRPHLPGRRRLLEGGDGACRARLAHAGASAAGSRC